MAAGGTAGGGGGVEGECEGKRNVTTDDRRAWGNSQGTNRYQNAEGGPFVAYTKTGGCE